MSETQVRPETVFLQHNDVFTVSDNMSTVTHTLLPGGVYLLGFSPLSGFYLTVQNEAATTNTKIYGSANVVADRIINTFRDRVGRTTGVLLGGEKGSGKTLLMSRISSILAPEGIPTIIINQSYTGDAFNAFIAAIKQPAVLAFDEFEKVYDAQQQEAILTLLSGLFETHKLVVMTVNDKTKINQHMVNRPGRLFYNIEYRGVDEETIRQYCQDKLKNQEHIDDIVSVSESIFGFNFDMLVSLVEEMNRYDEPVEKAIKLMNITFSAYGAEYEVTLIDEEGNMHKGNNWHGTVSAEHSRVVSFNMKSIPNEAKRNHIARELQKMVFSRPDKRDDSDLSFEYKQAKKDEDGEESTYIEDTREALLNEPENVVLDSSSWQQVGIHLCDETFVSNRGKTARFKYGPFEVVLRRTDRRPNPFSYI